MKIFHFILTLVFSGTALLLLTASLANSERVNTFQVETDSRCFSETGYCISGRIREFWEQNDGLRMFGLPITEQRAETIEEQTFQVQWFERNRLELHPEIERPNDIQLGRLGVDVLDYQGRNWFTFPQSEPQTGCRFFEETGHNVCGDILTRWQEKGIELDGRPGINEGESLKLFGLPLSDVQSEMVEGQQMQVQWFERARFELHPENAPPYNVLLGLLGKEGIPKVGHIAFTSYGDDEFKIYEIGVDGSELKELTSNDDSMPQWSPDGQHIAFVSSRDGNDEIYVMNADGSEQTNLTNSPEFDEFLHTWSPDGTRIAFVRDNLLRDNDIDSEIYVMNADGSGQTNLTNHPADDSQTAWSPDGTQIAFVSNRDGNDKIYMMNIDGSETYLTEYRGMPVWSPDNRYVAFSTGGGDIYIANFDGSAQVNLTNTNNDVRGSNWVANNWGPTWSPDGTQIAFASTRDGHAQIYIMNSDGSAQVNLSRSPFQDYSADWSPAIFSPLLNRRPDMNLLPDPSLCANVSDPVNARIRPATCVYQGDIVRIDITGFQPNEQFIFTVTTPNGRSQSSERPGIVQSTGELLDISYDSMYLAPGIWQASFEGDSGHTAIIWFEVLTP